MSERSKDLEAWNAEYNIQSPLIRLKSDVPDSDSYSDSYDEHPKGIEHREPKKDQRSLSTAKPFNRKEYMKNYMRGYMRNRSKQQKQKKINDEAIMRNAAELLVDIINVYKEYFTNEQLLTINNVCDTKKNEISYILQELTNEINKAKLFN